MTGEGRSQTPEEWSCRAPCDWAGDDLDAARRHMRERPDHTAYVSGPSGTGRSRTCIGLYGWLFGHKFKWTSLESWTTSDFCTRCGMPKGGWR